jgi:signal transduction histidine kinase
MSALRNGDELLAAARLDPETTQKRQDETATELETRSLRSSPMHLISWLAFGVSSENVRALPLYIPFAVLLLTVMLLRLGIIVLVIRKRQLRYGGQRSLLFQGPWLLAAATFAVTHTYISAHTIDGWEPLVVNAVAGLGGTSAIIFFAPYGRSTLAYVLLLTVPPGLFYILARGLDGRGLATIFMFTVFASLVAPMLRKAYSDYWSALIGATVLEERNRSLSAESERKSAFLAHISHELRTPLNGIIGMGGLLLESKLDDDQKKSAETVLSSARALLAMLNELLAAARLEARREVLDERPFAPGPTLLEAAEVFRGDAVKKGLAYSIQVEGLPPVALSDRGRIRQVLFNLLSNAVRFTDHGRIDISARMNGEMLEVRVKDTGRGVAVEERARLFARFSQLEGAEGGTGLGLWISKGLVELLGGEIGVESAGRGAGSCFYFRVPLKPASPRSNGVQARVLVVDDDEVNLRVARAMLESLGSTVIEARHGLEALATLQAVPIDLVLIDVQMPDVDGVTAVRMMRASGATTVPVLALTASADEETRARCRAAGVDDVLEKPTTVAALQQAIARFATTGGAD